MINFILNNKEVNTALPSNMLLLDFVRYHRNLTGTKIGCREGDCGACTVLVGEIKNDKLVYRSVTSCLMPLGNAHATHIVTIEGVNMEGLNFIQQSFAEEGATQCGFCTPGFIVSLAGFCLSEKEASYQQGVDAVNGNICRCTGYKSIERAIGKISNKLCERSGKDAIAFGIEQSILPAYFSSIKERLEKLVEKAANINILPVEPLKFVGGGTDLYVQRPDEMLETDIDLLLNKTFLKGIEQQGNECVMGASATVTDMMSSAIFQQYFPLLNKYLKLVSSTQIRNMATVAGNFVNASPIGDLTIFFLALDAKLTLSNGQSKRIVPLRNFYKGYKTLDKTTDEYIEQIRFTLPSANSHFNFEKISKRTNLDIASVNTAIHVKVDDNVITEASLSAGGIGPVPTYLADSAAFLQGKTISTELVQQLIEKANEEIKPIGDARGTATYKRLLLGQLIKAHFATLFPSLPIHPTNPLQSIYEKY